MLDPFYSIKERETIYTIGTTPLILDEGLSYACDTSAASLSMDLRNMLFSVILTTLLLAKELTYSKRNTAVGLMPVEFTGLIICPITQKHLAS